MGTYFKTIKRTRRFKNANDDNHVERYGPNLIFREIVDAEEHDSRVNVELFSGGTFVQPSWLAREDLELLENYSPQYAFSVGEFVRSCVSTHWQFNNDDSVAPFFANMDYLIALAIIQSDLKQNAVEGPNGARKGIFGIAQDEWNNFRKSDFGKFYEADDLMNPYAQIDCAAYQMHSDAKALSNHWKNNQGVGSEDDPYIPRFGELLRCRLFGVENTFAMQKELKAGNHGTTLDSFLATQLMPSNEIKQLLDERSEFMRTGKASDAPAESLQGFRNKVETKLDNNFKAALKLINEHSPLTVVDNSGSAPWMPIAEGQIDIKESDPNDHAQIAAYFTATGLNGTAATPWCAAFVAWCLDQAGGAAKESYQSIKFAAAASASWLNWGRPINLKHQPPVGAIVVMSPSSDTDEASHVGFFREYVPGTAKAKVKLLGGNQSNMVTHTDFESKDIISIRWLDQKFSSVDLGSATDPAFSDILNLIASKESGGNYNAFFGNGANQDNPRFTQMSITDVLGWQDQFVQSGSRSSAVGKYQIIRKTMRGLIKSMQLDTSNLFDENMQDKMAMKLMLGRGLKSFLSGGMSVTGFGNNLAKEWASFPVLSNIQGAHRSVTRGSSFYSGDNLNHAHVDPADVEAALQKLKGV